MAGRWRVNLYDTSYNQVAVFDSWNDLQIDKPLDTMATFKFSINGDDSRRSLFVTDAILEIERMDASFGLAWYTEFRGFIRNPGRTLDDRDKHVAHFTGRGFMDLIHRRHILYNNETVYSDKTAAGDDVAKAYVTENIGVTATAPPRLIAGVLTGFNVQAPSAAAPVGTFTQSYRNLYDAVREVALASGFDFEVVWTGSAGSPSWEFRTYYPRLGTDRTDASHGPLVFSPLLGNMRVPDYEKVREEEANSIIILGQGSGASRQVYITQTAARNDSPFNLIESVQSERQEDQAAGLAATANYYTQHLQATEHFTFETLQTSQSVYARDYFLGDKVIAQFDEISSALRILGVHINVTEGKETIKMDFGTLVQ